MPVIPINELPEEIRQIAIDHFSNYEWYRYVVVPGCFGAFTNCGRSEKALDYDHNSQTINFRGQSYTLEQFKRVAKLLIFA